MKAIVCAAACLLVVLPQIARAEYIEITVPEDGEANSPCAPSVVRWESDIDPGEGEVLQVSWARRGMIWDQGWRSLGTSSNDGQQPWPDRPCWFYYPFVLFYVVKVEHISNPSACDSVRFFMTEGWGEPTVFIDFSGTATNYGQVQSSVIPPQYTIVNAYVVLGGAPDGFTGVSFALDVGPPGVFVAPSFVNLLPGNLAIGSWGSGITLASTECLGSGGELVNLGYLSFFYLGGDGYIDIVDHPDFPRWVLDCEEPEGVLYYEVGEHGLVGGTPVEPATWGSIKAMYR